MAPLKNPRHELFVQLTLEGVKLGRTQGQNYERAGFKAQGHAAEVAASRLLKNAELRTRLAELTEPAVRKTRTTVDSLADQFDAVFDAAITEKQLSAAGTAAGLKAKLLGFMRDRLEIGAPGDFSGCDNVEDLVARLLSEMDSQKALQALDMLRSLIEQSAANSAQDVTPAPATHRPGVETSRALASLRPTRKGGRR